MSLYQTELQKRISASVLVSIVTLSIFGGIGIFYLWQPKASTCYYHFNIQYKAGNEATYDNIIYSMAHIIWMYGNHTTWRYTIETQFMTLEYMHDKFPDVFEALRSQNRNGQLELIVPQYSSAWHPPYPLKTFIDSINYTQARMRELGLIPSRLILLQEGQWLPGFVEIGDVGNFEAFIAHREQISYMNYYPDAPVLEWTWNGKTKHVIINPRLPRTEAGVYHFQIYAADGELLNTGDIEVDVGPAEHFAFNEKKQKNHEDHLLQLERMGVKFLRMDEMYRLCVERGHVEKMNKFIPEVEWVPAQYDQYFTWMGNGQGWTDDGSFLARVYWTMNYVRAVELILKDAFNSGIVSNSQYTLWGMNRINGVDGILLNASKKVWEAQVSDTTGITPNEFEVWYGFNRTFEAYTLAKGVLDAIRGLPGTVDKNYSVQFQVNPFINSIEFNSSKFINDSLISSSSILEIETSFGMRVQISQKDTFSKHAHLNYTTKVEKRKYDTKDWNVEYYALTCEFYGKFNKSWAHTNADFVYMQKERTPSIWDYKLADIEASDSGNDISIRFTDNWTSALYSPSLSENTTVMLNRTDYYQYKEGSSYEWLCLLAMCNGFLYNPQKGYGIVKNCSINHLPATWRQDSVTFRESKVKYNSVREYFIVSGSYDEVLRFANQINAYKPLNVEAL